MTIDRDCPIVLREFLSYHEFGKDKWKGKYQIENGFVPSETIKNFTTVFENRGLKCIKT